LKAGETCTYNVQADCGLPSLKPNDTTGFEIETVDYDDDDIADVPVTKAVQTAPLATLTSSTQQTTTKKEGDFSSDKKPPKIP